MNERGHDLSRTQSLSQESEGKGFKETMLHE